MGPFAYLAIILASLICQAKAQSTTIACEGSTLAINCGADQVIQTSSSFYGRTDVTTCNQGPVWNTTCKADTTTRVQQQCDGKQTCSIEASNTNFGDPCFGTYKYLSVTYRCVPRTALACEGTTLTINCGPDLFIQTSSSFYGRTDVTTCSQGPVWNTTCKADTTTRVQQQCDGKQTCSIEASNTNFGDPCFGTYKYLSVTYRCVQRTVIVCEGNTLRIDCGEYPIIGVTSSFYGRTDATTCNGGPIWNTTCKVDTTAILQRQCNTQHVCTIEASNTMFGDPCYGTYKYLSATYRCNTKDIPAY